MVIEVSDRGPGLPAGWEERIFAKFATPRVRGGGGVGLGLAICKGFVEVHGGWISAENRPGGGTVFRFAIPIGDGPPPLPPAEEEMTP